MNNSKLFQTVAFILSHNNNSLDYYNLIKECYIADRTSIDKTGFPITGDKYLSMHRGPVLEGLYSFIKNKNNDKSAQLEWNKFFKVDDHKISLLNNNLETDKLSEFEEDILKNVCNQFKDYSYKDMKDYAHQEGRFPEWESVEKEVSKPIEMKDIMHALNFSKEDIDFFINEQETFAREASLFHSI